MEKTSKLIPRQKRYQKSQEFHDWTRKFYHKDLTDPQKFKATYSDDFVGSIDVKILISKEYVKRKSRQQKGEIEENIQEEIEEFVEKDLKKMIVIPLTLIRSMKINGSDGCFEVEITLRYSNKFTFIFNEEYQNMSQKFENCMKNTIALVRGMKSTMAASWVGKYYRIFSTEDEMQAKDVVKGDIAKYIKYLNDLLVKSNKEKCFDCKGNIDVVGEGNFKTYEAKICATYPQFLFVPKSITFNQLQTVMKFRTKNRIPAMCYLHAVNKCGRLVLSALWRSGQIKTGLTGSRKAEDEKFVAEIGRLTHFNNHKRVTVFDCRPWKNAAANMFAGKGYLNAKNYNLNEIIFGNIDNIHVMRSSYNSVHSSFFKGNSMSAIAEWYGHIKKLLEGAHKCATLISKGHTVIVNCSDGWDRTPQTTSLIKILLNKRFRTFTGFRQLINYEFIGFGHKFQDRQNYEDGKEGSPIFIQFLDSVYQILVQNPQEFEFNSLYLKDLAMAHIENRFQEFAHNKFLDLIKSRVKGLSVWGWLHRRRIHYINLNYKFKPVNFFELNTKIDPTLEADSAPLEIETHPFYLKIWNDFHMSPIENSLKLTKHDKDLQSHIKATESKDFRTYILREEMNS